MNRNNKSNFKYFIIIVFFIFSLVLSQSQIVKAEDSNNETKKTVVVLEYFYGETCGTCEKETAPVVNQIENYYGNKITVYKLEVQNNFTNQKKMFDYGINSYPGVAVINLSSGNYSTLNYSEISKEKNPKAFENIKNQVDYHLKGDYSIEPPDPVNKLCFGFFCIDPEEVSLPILTIVLGFFDSLNPCSFFILLFLLNLLIYAKSRKKMALIGGIFIFFSGFIYFILMVMIFLVFETLEQPIIISLIAGSVAIIFGLVNIKDFFFFKKGFSLSVSDDKKKSLFQRMRDIIKIKHLPTMILGTIVLAIFANTYELGCTLILPVVYINTLKNIHMVSAPDAYFYILFYNIMYVIPLIIIVSIFVITLGRRKLSEFQGRSLKLFSGTMIFSFGIIMIINPELLKDLTWMIGLFIGSVVSTYIISYIWRKKIEKQDE